jgi:L-ribulokinase
VLALDWLNGCRTPLMDGSLTGALVGLTLDTGPEQVYRAMLEGSAFGLRWIVDTLRAGGVPVERLVATGGLAVRNPLFVRIAASALGIPVAVHSAAHGSAQGAAILGALAAGRGAGGFDDVYEAVASMAGAASVLPAPMIVHPELDWAPVYERQYGSYRRLAEQMARKGSVMRPCHGSPRSGEP